MYTVYIYVLDTLADWELGHISAELNSKRFFKEGAQKITVKTVSYSKDSIRTMGGMMVIPDYLISDIILSETSVLLLPGADTWNDLKHTTIIEKASELLSIGATVGAICGATTALANFGLLDKYHHTSNGVEFLKMFSANYKGENFYINEPFVVDGNLITASATGELLWTKQIIEHLNIFQLDTLEAWYNYFSTGKPEYFFNLMQTLQPNEY